MSCKVWSESSQSCEHWQTTEHRARTNGFVAQVYGVYELIKVSRHVCVR